MIFNLSARVENGRRFAYGIGCDADFSKAYECWSGIEGCLSPEDKQIFLYIKEILNSEIVDDKSCYAPNYANTSAIVQIAAKKMPENYSEHQVRELFDELLSEACESGNFKSLYLALEKYKNSKKEKHNERKPANIRFGNNLGMLIQVFWGTKQNLFNKMNLYLRNKGLDEKKSIQNLYQIIAGKNGMDSAGKLIIVEMVNELNSRRMVLSRSLEVKDLDLPHDEFLKLFNAK